MMKSDETVTSPVPTAADDAAEAADHGRIGYGRLGRFSPLVLGVLLLLVVGAIWWSQRDTGVNTPSIGQATGQPAPDFTLTLLDGRQLRMSELRGNVVVLNFWASWCAPCRQEMPALQAYWDEAQQAGEKTVIVGVGIRTDHDAEARALVSDLGLSYPIGRDTDTDQPGIGPIEKAYGVPAAYPITIVVRADGVIDGFHVGPLTQSMLGWMVNEARRNGPE